MANNKVSIKDKYKKTTPTPVNSGVVNVNKEEYLKRMQYAKSKSEGTTETDDEEEKEQEDATSTSPTTPTTVTQSSNTGKTTSTPTTSGDVLSTVQATANDVGANIVAGYISQGIGGLINWGASLFSGFLGLFNSEQTKDLEFKIDSFVNGNYATNDITNFFLNPLDWLQSKYNSSYYQAANGESTKTVDENLAKYREGSAINNLDENVQEGIRSAAQSIGGMAATSWLQPLAGTSFAGDVAALAPMGISAWGNSTQEALSQGADKGEAQLYGLLSGLTEMGTELFVGKGLEKIGLGTGKLMGLFGKSSSKAGSNTLINLLKTFNEEGTEEVVSDLLQPLWQMIYKNNGQSLITQYSDNFQDNGGWGGLLSSYLVGGSVGALMGGGELAVNTAKYGSKGVKVLSELQAANEIVEEYQNKVTHGEKLTQKQIANYEKQIGEHSDKVASLLKEIKSNGTDNAKFTRLLSDIAGDVTADIQSGKKQTQSAKVASNVTAQTNAEVQATPTTEATTGNEVAQTNTQVQENANTTNTDTATDTANSTVQEQASTETNAKVEETSSQSKETVKQRVLKRLSEAQTNAQTKAQAQSELNLKRYESVLRSNGRYTSKNVSRTLSKIKKSGLYLAVDSITNGKVSYTIGKESQFENGDRAYIVDGQHIVINPKYQGEIRKIISHEAISHAILDTNSKEFTKLENTIKKIVGEEAFTKYDEQLKEDYKQEIKDADGNVTGYKEASESTIRSERMARLIEDFIGNDAALSKIAKMQDEGKALTRAKTVLNYIKKLISGKTAKSVTTTQNRYGQTTSINVDENTRSEIINAINKAITNINNNRKATTTDIFGKARGVDPNLGLVQKSVKSIFEGAGLKFNDDPNGFFITDKDGNHVEKVTVDMIKGSPMGNMIKLAVEEGNISQADAKEQYQVIADMLDLCNKTNSALGWELLGSAAFSAIRSNSEPQYKTTIDFTTVCKKTLAMIDVVSRVQLKEGHGLTKAQIMDCYYEVAKAGEPVPCAVCYVFSRWMGAGSIRDRVVKYQDRFSKYTDQEITDFMNRIEKGVREFFDNRVKKEGTDFKLGKELANQKGKVESALEKIDNMQESIEDSLNTLEQAINNVALDGVMEDFYDLGTLRSKLKQYQSLLNKRSITKEEKKAIQKEIDKLQKTLDKYADFDGKYDEFKKLFEDLEAYQYVARTFAKKDKKTGKWSKDPKFQPINKDLILDLRKGAELSTESPKNWTYITTRGSGAGKAITPYSDFRVGELITNEAFTTKAGKQENVKKATVFMSDVPDDVKKQKEYFAKAKTAVRIANLLGGQRFQSTSDFRIEYGSDYVMAFLEAQALGMKGQVYTKVIEAVDFLASCGLETNLSLISLGKGYVELEDGRKALIFSNRSGINYEAGLEMVKKYNNVQFILVGINQTQIELALGDDNIMMLIPYHASGNSPHTLQSLFQMVDETLEADAFNDYAAYEYDHEIEDATDEQKAARKVRKDILMGKLANPTEEQLKTINGNKYLKELWNRFYKKGYDSECYGVKLDTKQAGQIFPFEYWDKSLTKKDADVNGERFKEYCESLGYHPRFSGWDEEGNYHEEHDISNFKGYWKTLIDRSMYNNDGTYHEPSKINVNNFNVGMISSRDLHARYDGFYESIGQKMEWNESRGEELAEKAYKRIHGESEESHTIQYSKKHKGKGTGKKEEGFTSITKARPSAESVRSAYAKRIEESITKELNRIGKKSGMTVKVTAIDDTGITDKTISKIVGDTNDIVITESIAERIANQINNNFRVEVEITQNTDPTEQTGSTSVGKPTIEKHTFTLEQVYGKDYIKQIKNDIANSKVKFGTVEKVAQWVHDRMAEKIQYAEYRYEKEVLSNKIEKLAQRMIDDSKSANKHLIGNYLQNDVIALKNAIGKLMKTNSNSDMIDALKTLNSLYKVADIDIETDILPTQAITPIGTYYNQEIKDMLEELSGKDELSTSDLAKVVLILRNFRHDIGKAANGIVLTPDGKYISKHEQINHYHDIQKQNPYLNLNGLTGKANQYVINFADPSAVFEMFDGYNVFGDGFLTDFKKMIEERQNVLFQNQKGVKEIDDEYKKEIKEYIKGKNEKFKINTGIEEVTLTRGDMLTLYMTIMDAEGKETINTSGFDYRDKNNAYYVHHQTDDGEKMNADTIKKSIEEHLTENDKQMIEYYSKLLARAKTLKAETDIQRTGISNVKDGFYFPMSKSRENFKTEYGELIDSYRNVGNINNIGANKSRTKSRIGSIDIVPIDELMSSYMSGIEHYNAYGIAIEYFNTMMNSVDLSDTETVVETYKEKGEEKTRVVPKHIAIYKYSNNNVKQQLTNYVRGWLNDIQGFQSTKETSIIGKGLKVVRGAAVVSTLVGNVASIASQPVSVINAAPVVGWNYISKAVALAPKSLSVKTHNHLMEKSPYFWNRFATNEIASGSYVSTQLNKLQSLSMSPQSMTDAMAINTIYEACKMKIKKKYGVKTLTEEQDMEAIKLCERATRDTQPNFNSVERSKAQRSGNELDKTLVAFSTQQGKNLSRFISSYARGKYIKKAHDTGKISDAEYKSQMGSAKKAAASFTTAILVSGITYTMIKEMIKFLMGKRDKDDYGEDNPYWKTFAMETFSNTIVSMFPIVKDIYGALFSGYDISVMQIDKINDCIDGITSTVDDIKKIAGGESVSVGETIKDVASILNTFLPVKNLYDDAYSLMSMFSASAAYKTKNFFYATSTENSDYKKAISNGNKDLASTILETAFVDNINGSKPSTSVINQFNKLVKAGYTNIIPTSVGDTMTIDGTEYKLTKSQKEKFQKVYAKANSVAARMVASASYNALSNEGKAKALRSLYSYYYDYAKKTLKSSYEVSSSIAGVVGGNYSNVVTLLNTMAYCSTLEADGNTTKKSMAQSYINGLKGITSTEKYLYYYLAGYTISDSQKSTISTYLKKIGYKQSDINDILNLD